MKQFVPAGVLTVAALALALVLGGPKTAAVVAILGILEVSLSFDNAVVNAKVLTRMHPIWQRLFLTVGILIAVFGMRLVLPVIVVAVTAHLSIPDVIDLAINSPKEYGERLADSEVAIYAFGGTFLLMIFLDFVLDPEREIVWLRPIELALQRVGKLDQVSVVIALAGLYVMKGLATKEEQVTVFVAGVAGLIAYLLVSALDNLFEAAMEDEDDTGEVVTPTGKMTKELFKAGIFTFLYLEVLDASFSFDGVIGAFAISDEVLVIALGLGIGAFWIRSLTLFMVKAGTLDAYRYLEHGAMWAIGALAGIMLASVKYEVSEVITGLTGVVLIGLAIATSVAHNKRDAAVEASESIAA